MNKRDSQTLSMYNRSSITCLEQAYKNCSQAKKTAEFNIKREMVSLNGYGFKILGKGKYSFSCAYKIKIDGSEYLVYHTKGNRRIFKIE